ncbi:unnamed protein product, partial [Staurois parvus]
MGPCTALLMLLPGPECVMGPCTASHCCCQARNLPWAPIPTPHAAARPSVSWVPVRASHCCCQAVICHGPRTDSSCCCQVPVICHGPVTRLSCAARAVICH